MEPKAIVAARMLHLLEQSPDRDEAMQEVVERMEQEDLLQYSPTFSSPRAFSKSVILDNPDLQLTDLQVQNAQEAESPLELVTSLLIR